jgi:hypothetical protein
MNPRIEPLTVPLKRGAMSRQMQDHLYLAWASVSKARAVPYEAARPHEWLQSFHAAVEAALAAFEAHASDAESPGSRLVAWRASAALEPKVARQLDDHGRLRQRIHALVDSTRRQDANVLGQVVRANEDAALLELYLSLHHRRLCDLFADAGLISSGAAAAVVTGGR